VHSLPTEPRTDYSGIAKEVRILFLSSSFFFKLSCGVLKKRNAHPIAAKYNRECFSKIFLESIAYWLTKGIGDGFLVKSNSAGLCRIGSFLLAPALEDLAPLAILSVPFFSSW